MAPGGGGDCAGGSAQAASTSAAAVASTSGSKGGGATAGAMKKGPWTAAEDSILIEYVRKHGEGNWNAVQKNCGLSRCGKSCRLRWANHLRPNLKKGPFSPDEERLILELHSKLGNKWARMAAQLPGRTDNEIKNYWNTRIKRRQRAGLPLYPPDIQHHTTFLHHHHHRQPTSALNAASLTEHKALYSTSVGATPLSLLDPVTFAAPTSAATTTTPAASPTFLGLGHHAPFLVPSTSQKPLKHLRDDADADADAGGFYLPFHAATTHHVAPPPSSQDPFFTFNSLASFDLGPPPPLPQQHSGDNHHPSGFPVKLELPSSQLFSEPCRPIAPFDGLPPLGGSNSELLDALLRDTQAMVGDDGKGGEASCFHQCHDRLPRDGGDGELSQGLALGSVGGKWDDPDHHSANVVPRREAAADAGAVEDDLSALLDLIPMAPAAAREWYKYNSDSAREGSNGPSSGVTDENLGLELHRLASSSLSMAAAEENHSWSVGSCRWNDAPASG